MAKQKQPIEVNGRRYNWPDAPLVVVCIDGSEPAYMEEAIKAGAMPWLAAVRQRGTYTLADCVVPSFTNPNNLSIVTGAPPAVHGICGNYFYDRDTGTEVMMNDPKYLRAADHSCRILQGRRQGCRGDRQGQAAPPARKGRWKGICFSAEKANKTTRAENGIDNALAKRRPPVALRLQRRAVRDRLCGRAVAARK